MVLTTILARLLLAGLVVYAGVVAVLYFGQRILMYLPDRTRTEPAAAGLPQAEEITLATPDGEKLVAWHVAPREKDRPVILYFQGNGGAMRHRGPRFAALAKNGFGLLAVAYRGYGGSTGSPSEAGLLIDADTAYAFCAERYGPDRIVVFGESLGTGVAVALAATKKVARLILQAPYTSTADVARLAYPYVPIGVLMKDQFRSDLRVRAVTAPTLILHGTADGTIPIDFGERLYAEIKAPKRFVRLAGADHEDLDDFGALDAVRAFLATAPEGLE